MKEMTRAGPLNVTLKRLDSSQNISCSYINQVITFSINSGQIHSSIQNFLTHDFITIVATLPRFICFSLLLDLKGILKMFTICFSSWNTKIRLLFISIWWWNNTKTGIFINILTIAVELFPERHGESMCCGDRWMSRRIYSERKSSRRKFNYQRWKVTMNARIGDVDLYGTCNYYESILIYL